MEIDLIKGKECYTVWNLILFKVFLRDAHIFGGKEVWLALVNEPNRMLGRFISSDGREMTYFGGKGRWN